MTNSVARVSERVLARADVVAPNLYGGKSNAYYAEDSQRIVRIEVRTNDLGQYRTYAGHGRWIESLSRVTVDRWEYASPVFSSTDEARIDANRVWEKARTVYTGRACDSSPDANLRVGPYVPAVSYCNRCGNYGTHTVEMLSYGNLTTCTVESCDFRDYYSIGD